MFYGFIGFYFSVLLVFSIFVLNDWNFKVNRNENVIRGLKGLWEFILCILEIIIVFWLFIDWDLFDFELYWEYLCNNVLCSDYLLVF